MDKKTFTIEIKVDGLLWARLDAKAPTENHAVFVTVEAVGFVLAEQYGWNEQDVENCQVRVVYSDYCSLPFRRGELIYGADLT